MIPVCGVRFTKAGKIYYFDPGDHQVDVGMRVIVETAQGIECGEIAVAPKLVPEEDVVQPVRRIMRIADEEDLNAIREARQSEKEAFEIACEHVEKLGIDMKIVDAEWTFDKQKLVFYFVADERVDFRELVKVLAASFRTRIELRQIGVRDQSKMLGGYGVCGRALCCSSWIGDFEPISIRHAKEQELSLNPGKISGVCGRLKCCLRFEVDTYQEIRQRMPKVGTSITTPEGTAKVIELHVIKEAVTLLFDDGDELRRKVVTLEELERMQSMDPAAYQEYAAARQPEADLNLGHSLEELPEVEAIELVTTDETEQPATDDAQPTKRSQKRRHRRSRGQRHRPKRAKQRKEERKS